MKLGNASTEIVPIPIWLAGLWFLVGTYMMYSADTSLGKWYVGVALALFSVTEQGSTIIATVLGYAVGTLFWLCILFHLFGWID